MRNSKKRARINKIADENVSKMQEQVANIPNLYLDRVFDKKLKQMNHMTRQGRIGEFDSNNLQEVISESLQKSMQNRIAQEQQKKKYDQMFDPEFDGDSMVHRRQMKLKHEEIRKQWLTNTQEKVPVSKKKKGFSPEAP